MRKLRPCSYSVGLPKKTSQNILASASQIGDHPCQHPLFPITRVVLSSWQWEGKQNSIFISGRSGNVHVHMYMLFTCSLQNTLIYINHNRVSTIKKGKNLPTMGKRNRSICLTDVERASLRASAFNWTTDTGLVEPFVLKELNSPSVEKPVNSLTKMDFKIREMVKTFFNRTLLTQSCKHKSKD